MRIDKYIWTIRLCKTRSIATKECNSEKVKLNGTSIKASRNVSKNDLIEIKVNPIWRTYKVIGFPKSRVGAKLVSEYVEEITDASLISELEQFQHFQKQTREQGFKGRPTKKDRRKLDDYSS